MTDKLIMDKDEILKYIVMEPPYVFVDYAEVLPGISSNGYRDFPADEWFFKCHFPNDPVVPGVFQLELLMHTAVLALYSLNEPDIGILYGRKFMNVDCLAYVRPNERLYSETEIKSFKRGCALASGNAYVMRDGEKVITCKAEFQMVSPQMINKLLPPRKENINA